MNLRIGITCFLTILMCGLQATAQVTTFRSVLSEDYVVLGGVRGTGSTAGGVAEFTLTQDPANPNNNTLTYDIVFDNVDLDGTQTASILDNITALHIHDITRCAPPFPQCIEGTDTAGTIHLLNIFGLPRNDDADVMVDPAASRITGIWDVTDTSAPGTPAPSLSIADPAVIDLLLSEQAAIFVHTNEIPTAASGGLLSAVVPEPTSIVLAMLAGLSLLGLRRR